MINQGMMTSKEIKWNTPLAYDAFSVSWAQYLVQGHGIWMNPPYGRTIGKWIDKAYREHLSSGHAPVVCLLPSRTDTKWWHTYCQPVLDGKVKGKVDFIRGRIHFTNANTGVTGPAPFPSVVVVFGGEP